MIDKLELVMAPARKRHFDRPTEACGVTRPALPSARLTISLSGNLRIGVIPTALPMVAERTAPFIGRHPNLRVSVLSRTSGEMAAGIESLDPDASITCPAPTRSWRPRDDCCHGACGRRML